MNSNDEEKLSRIIHKYKILSLFQSKNYLEQVKNKQNCFDMNNSNISNNRYK